MNVPAMIAAIDAAKLPTAITLTARRLLDRADGSYTRVAYDEAMDICGTQKDNTVRGHLSRLASAGLISYRRNSCIHVFWHAPDDELRAAHDQNARPARETRETSAPSEPDAAALRAPHDQNARGTRETRATPSKRAPHDHPAKDLTTAGRQEDPSTCLPGEGAGGATAPDAPAGPGPEERAASLALLTAPEVGLKHERAASLAARYPFATIRAAVFQALRDLEAGRIRSLNVLGVRLARGYTATVTSQDEHSELGRRHRWAPDDGWWLLPAADTAAAAAEPDSAEPDAAGAQPVDAALAAARTAWGQLQAEYALTAPPGGADGLIQDVWVVSVEEGDAWLLGVADAFRFDWVVKKLRKQIERKLLIIVGRPISLSFQVRVKS